MAKATPIVTKEKLDLLLIHLGEIANACANMKTAGHQLIQDQAGTDANLVIALSEQAGWRADDAIKMLTGSHDVVGDWIDWTASPAEKEARAKLMKVEAGHAQS